ncbi:hypothetical protein LXL04_018796 [Taraxacum kok-saghyz]
MRRFFESPFSATIIATPNTRLFVFFHRKPTSPCSVTSVVSLHAPPNRPKIHSFSLHAFQILGFLQSVSDVIFSVLISPIQHSGFMILGSNLNLFMNASWFNKSDAWPQFIACNGAVDNEDDNLIRYDLADAVTSEEFGQYLDLKKLMKELMHLKLFHDTMVCPFNERYLLPDAGPSLPNPGSKSSKPRGLLLAFCFGSSTFSALPRFPSPQRERQIEQASERERGRQREIGRRTGWMSAERESQFVIEGETERGVLPDEESQLVIEGETESKLAIGNWRLEIWNCTGDWQFEIAIGDLKLRLAIGDWH